MKTTATGSSFFRHMTFALAVLCGLVAASGARAQTWTEVGDAGDLAGTAQITIGSGPLGAIDGNLASPTDVDLYCVWLPATPPAGLPLVQLLCTLIQGPNVWLFDASGKGVLSGSTCSAGDKTILAPNSSLAPGNYYVAVSYYGYDPQAVAGAIWLSGAPFQRAPDGPGATGTLTGWAGTPNVQPMNPYHLNLTYLDYCDAATPTSRATWGAVKQFYR